MEVVQSAKPAGPPSTPATVSVPTTSHSVAAPPPSQAPPPSPAKPPLVASPPVKIHIHGVLPNGAAFDSTTVVEPVTAATDGSLGVPENVSHVGWWSQGALPGAAQGRAVIDGHVDSAAQGIGFLFYLRFLQPGNVVDVTTAAGQVLHYVIYGGDEWPKPLGAHAPQVMNVAGPPGLTLITCGGEFIRSAGSYRDNVLKYGQLADYGPA